MSFPLNVVAWIKKRHLYHSVDCRNPVFLNKIYTKFLYNFYWIPAFAGMTSAL
ncbi:MAG TPA: hypothetical protein LFV92_05610 [Rickettsia endosymbiont of Ceroptres masudai]|nr:hypothetical protein [Rickettsia endosymbiont of Ceroptres masudai]